MWNPVSIERLKAVPNNNHGGPLWPIPVGPFSHPFQPRRTSFNHQQVGIAAAVRSPRPEIRSRAILDYGVATGQR